MGQTLKFGNGNFATKAGSTLCYDDQNGNFKPIPMDFTRASTATRVNKQGLIEVVKSNVPRIDYTDTSDGVFLLEKAATNLVTYSEDFSNASWLKSNSSVTSNAIISPNGALNADKLIATSVSAPHRAKATLGTVSGNYTFSIFAKKGEYKNILVWDDSIGGGVGVNLDDLSVFRDVNNQGYKIEDYGNGWIRISTNLTYVSQQIRCAIYVYDNSATPQITFVGNDSDGLYIFGAQLEVGNASSYIPTQGSASTRVAETASGAGNSEVFNDSQGVLFANIAANSNDGTSRQISLSSGSSSTNKVSLIYTSTSNQIQAFIRAGGSISFNETITVSDLTNFNKIILKYKQDNFSLWINGFEVSTDASGNAPTGLNVLDFDDADGTSDFYGKTKEIGYYNTILTDLELETLTSYKSWTSMVNELNLNIIYNG